MQDFAALLIEARKNAGLTQAQLAVSAGLTPSYLSFIENRKKPPPSDAVCRRLAKVLHLPEKAILDVAHIERAPEQLQKRVRTLTHTLKREKKSRARLLTSLLSPFLFAGPPGFRESALESMDLTPVRKRRIRQALSASRNHDEREAQIAKLVDELPERDRLQLLERLAKLVTDQPGAQTSAASPTLLYEAPQPGDDKIVSPYLLQVTEAVAADMDELKENDLLLVDMGQRPGLGDLLVLHDPEGFQVRRLEAAGDEFQLASDGGDVARWTARDLSARLDQVCSGTVMEIRRTLRRRSES